MLYIGFDEKTNKKQIQIVSSETGCIQHGSRWSNGIHEFIEVKEKIEPETERNVNGSISHPTYFQNYKILFGLTGPIGETIERKEINEVYKMRCFDIPRNFKELLIRETIKFGKQLKKLFLDFFILNDVQKENKDYILNNTGHCVNILIAINEAGRGTYIIIDDLAKQNGGLYANVGFFPQNSRIEFQAIGRAGRQGNP